MPLARLQRRLSRGLRDRGKLILRRVFELGQRAGVDVLPRHFYSSVPDIRQLRASQAWRQPRTMVGVAGLDIDSQTKFLRELLSAPVQERLRKRDVYRWACEQNGATGYGPTEAALLYAFVATQRPGRVVQVGAGVATAVILAAADDVDLDVAVTCVDPYPTGLLHRLAAEGRIDLVEKRAQDVALETFTGLTVGDLLFVDSTHTVKADSEVNRIILEVLPRLAPGVVVHFHDIWFPYDYPRDLLDETLFFWTESVLLHAYLADNPRVRVLMAASMLHYEAPDEMAALIPRYQPQRNAEGLRGSTSGHFPSSAYLEIIPPADPGDQLASPSR